MLPVLLRTASLPYSVGRTIWEIRRVVHAHKPYIIYYERIMIPRASLPPLKATKMAS